MLTKRNGCGSEGFGKNIRKRQNKCSNSGLEVRTKRMKPPSGKKDHRKNGVKTQSLLRLCINAYKIVLTAVQLRPQLCQQSRNSQKSLSFGMPNRAGRTGGSAAPCQEAG